MTPIPHLKFLSLPWFVPVMVDEEGHDWEVEEPVVERDGWFYDRKAKKSWFEYNGVAYVEKRVDDFLYNLNVVHSDHSFKEDELQAIILLRLHKLLRRTDPLFVKFMAYVQRRYLECLRAGKSRSDLSDRWRFLQMV